MMLRKSAQQILLSCLNSGSCFLSAARLLSCTNSEQDCTKSFCRGIWPNHEDFRHAPKPSTLYVLDQLSRQKLTYVSSDDNIELNQSLSNIRRSTIGAVNYASSKNYRLALSCCTCLSCSATTNPSASSHRSCGYARALICSAASISSSISSAWTF